MAQMNADKKMNHPAMKVFPHLRQFVICGQILWLQLCRAVLFAFALRSGSAFAFFQSGTVSAPFLAVHLCGSLCFQGFLQLREPVPVHASVASVSWKFGQFMSESDVLSRGNFNPDS